MTAPVPQVRRRGSRLGLSTSCRCAQQRWGQECGAKRRRAASGPRRRGMGRGGFGLDSSLARSAPGSRAGSVRARTSSVRARATTADAYGRAGQARRRATPQRQPGAPGSCLEGGPRAAQPGRPEAVEASAPCGAEPAGAPVLPDRAPAVVAVSVGAPGDGPERRRPGLAAAPGRDDASEADEGSAGGAGAARWGRWSAAARAAGRQGPRPAWRTQAPSRRRRAPAREASASSGGRSSAGGTCVRKARDAVGRTCTPPSAGGFRLGRIRLSSELFPPRVLQRRLHGPGGGACAAPRGGAGGPATREGRRRARGVAVSAALRRLPGRCGLEQH